MDTPVRRVPGDQSLEKTWGSGLDTLDVDEMKGCHALRVSTF